MREIREHQRPNMPLQVILYKSRRTGGSTWAVALLTAHALAKRGAKCKILAQLDKTAKELYEERAQPFAEAIRRRGVDIKSDKTEIHYNFQGGHYSKLDRATAKTVIGGRGLTASALLMSEAAYYPGEESFVSMVNTLSKDPDNIIIIETTPNGIEGQGQAFYNYWHAAIDGDNGFIPIFMPWYEDPGFTLPDSMAPDAPKGEYERWLSREFHCTKGQIAWYRWTMAKACAGNHDLMKQDYPSTPEEGFISSGRPAFDSIELAAAKRDNLKPLHRGTIITTDSGIPIFEERDSGEIRVWELPQPKGQYYIGADAAKGVGTGDFAAAVGWNGDTGRMAFRFAERIPPETLAYFLNGLGRFYNNAMINIEFTGGWGATAAQELRDRYYYPQQYLWRGSRDDKVHAKASTALGWETTQRSRRMLFDRFRLALRRNEAHVCDQAFLAQMSRAQMEMPWNWQVIKGHDDIFMCFPTGTPVQVASGFRPIEAVRAGQWVLSGQGRLRRIVTVSQRRVTEDFISLRYMGSYRTLVATANHPFLVARYKWMKRGTKTRKKLLAAPPKWKPASDIELGDYLFMPKRTNLAPSPFTEDVLWLMGWYLAEGSIGRGTVSFAMHENEIDVANWLSEILIKYDPPASRFANGRIYDRNPPKVRRSAKTKGIKLDYCSPLYWAPLLEKYCGKGSYTKRIHTSLYNSNGLMPLVRGLFEGDGCQTKGCDRNHLSLSTTSEALVWQVHQILLDETIWSTVCKSKSQDIHILHTAPEFFPRFGKSCKIKPVERKFHKRHVVESVEGFWVPVKGATRKIDTQTIYNLTVDGDHTFVAGGVAVHNSGLLGWIAVEQYHTPRSKTARAELLDKPVSPDATSAQGVSWTLDPFTTEMGMLLDHGSRHLKALEKINKAEKKTAGANLEGV